MHGLDQEGLDRLFGFSSKGRASRRWEQEGAPAYVGVIMAYIDQHGLALAQEMASQREAA